MNRISDIKKGYKNLPDHVKAAMWFTICSFIQSGISYISTPLFTRLMSTGDYGIYNVYITWQNILSIFVTLNLASGVYMRGLIKYDEDREKFSASVQGLFIIVFIIYLIPIGLLLGGISDLISLPDGYILGMMIDLFFVMSFRFWSVRKRVDYEYKRLVGLTVFNALLKTLIELFAVIRFTDSASGRIYGMIIADIISFGWLLFEMIIKTVKGFSIKYFKYALNYNIPLVPHYLSQILLSQSDRIMIREFCGKDDSGKYSLAYNLATSVQILSQAILNAYNPWMYQQIKKKNYNEVRTFSMVLLLLVASVCLLLMLMAPEVMMIFAPGEYRDAVLIIPVVTISVYFIFLYSLFANFEFYFEKNSFMMLASSCAAVLNVMLNMLFIPLYGYMAAAFTTLFCYMAYTLFHYCVMRKILYKEIGIKSIYDDKKIVLLSMGLNVIGGSLWFCYDYIIVRYMLVFVVIGLLIYNRKKILFYMGEKKVCENDGN